jgi:hypothetical protein
MICNRLTAQPLTAQTRAALERLARLDADAVDTLAKAALFLEIGEPERVAGDLAFAALQVHWTRLAGLIDATGFKTLDRPGMRVAARRQPRALKWIAGRLALSRMRALRDGVAPGAHQMRQLRLYRGYRLL